MTSLEENVGEVGSLRRLYLGVGLFVVGALLVVVGIVVSTTGVHAALGLEWWQGREIAGVLAGLGVPAVFVGVFTVLPASQRVRAAAAIGAGVAVLGVALFAHAYPYMWAGAGNGADLTAQVAATYCFGVLVTFWCLFVAVANFKTRNDPGGTVTLEISREGEVRTVEVDREDLEEFDDLDGLSAVRTQLAEADGAGDEPAETGLGGVGFFGDGPDGETPTQTNRAGAAPTSDGGTAANDIRSPLDGAAPDRADRPDRTTDTYCGNCRHFEYVRTNDGMAPYCGYYGRTMDDMDACEEWEPNR
jgi:cytochrome c biogenesis protein CcdA